MKERVGHKPGSVIACKNATSSTLQHNGGYLSGMPVTRTPLAAQFTELVKDQP